MKKQFILLVVGLCMATVSFGQTKFGLGATYVDDFGVQARASISLGESLGVIPSFSYYFPGSGITAYSIDVNLTYGIADLGDGMPLYILAGLDRSTVSVDGFGSNSEIGLNVGAGLDVTSSIYLELFYRKFFCDNCGGEIGFNAGYYF